MGGDGWADGGRGGWAGVGGGDLSVMGKECVYRGLRVGMSSDSEQALLCGCFPCDGWIVVTCVMSSLEPQRPL